MSTIILITTILIFGGANPQQSEVFTFSGTVVDSLTSQPLPFVNIIFFKEDGSIIDGTTTDLDGQFEKKFSVDQIKGLTKVDVQFMGYMDKVFLFELDDRTRYHYQIELKPDTVELAPLTITTMHIMTTKGCITRSIVIDENGDTITGRHKDWIKYFEGAD